VCVSVCVYAQEDVAVCEMESDLIARSQPCPAHSEGPEKEQKGMCVCVCLCACVCACVCVCVLHVCVCACVCVYLHTSCVSTELLCVSTSIA